MLGKTKNSVSRQTAQPVKVAIRITQVATNPVHLGDVAQYCYRIIRKLGWGNSVGSVNA